MAKVDLNKRKRKKLKQKLIIKGESQKRNKRELKPKKRSIKEFKGPVKREEKRRYLLFRGRATLKKSTLKKLALIRMKNI